MKYVLISNRFFSIYNSRQKLVNYLASKHEVIIIAQFDGFEKKLKSIEGNKRITYVNYSFSLKSLFTTILSIRRLITKEQPSVVHAFNPLPIFVSAYIKRRFKYNLIITMTGLGGAYGHKSKLIYLYDLLYKFSIKMADRVVFQNSDDYKYFSEKISPTLKSKIEVITSSGVDLSRFTLKKDLYPVRKSFKILFIARLMKQKGIKYLIDISDMLIGKGIEIHIFGEYIPSHKDSISNREYRELIENENVVFHGFVENIESQYVLNDLLICCSLREGAPRVILEAGASGIPVIAFDVPGVRECVENGVNGFLVYPFDVVEFVKRIITMKENKALYTSISQNARIYIENGFSQNIILEKYSYIYNTFNEK